jgi:hypothetical protein
MLAYALKRLLYMIRSGRGYCSCLPEGPLAIRMARYSGRAIGLYIRCAALGRAQKRQVPPDLGPGILRLPSRGDARRLCVCWRRRHREKRDKTSARVYMRTSARAACAAATMAPNTARAVTDVINGRIAASLFSFLAVKLQCDAVRLRRAARRGVVAPTVAVPGLPVPYLQAGLPGGQANQKPNRPSLIQCRKEPFRYT